MWTSKSEFNVIGREPLSLTRGLKNQLIWRRLRKKPWKNEKVLAMLKAYAS
jgi:hypothetical protein